MSMFYRRLLVLAVMVAGTGTGLAQAADSDYTPQGTPRPSGTTPTQVLPTTIIKTVPTPQARSAALAKALTAALDGVTRKNLISGTKIAFTVTGGGSVIVQVEVAKKGRRSFRSVTRLHVPASGTTKATLKVGKAGKKRLVAAASKRKKFKAHLVIVFYTAKGVGRTTTTFTVKG